MSPRVKPTPNLRNPEPCLADSAERLVTVAGVAAWLHDKRLRAVLGRAVTDALAYAGARKHEGDELASAALDDQRHTGDITRLHELLARAVSAAEKQGPRGVSLNRLRLRVAGLALLRGDYDAGIESLSAIIADDPSDADAAGLLRAASAS